VKKLNLTTQKPSSGNKWDEMGATESGIRNTENRTLI